MTTTSVAKDPEQRRAARQIWLNYYNDYLRDCGVITEQAWRKMRLSIDRSSPAQPKARQTPVEQSRLGPGEAGQEMQSTTMTMH